MVSLPPHGGHYDIVAVRDLLYPRKLGTIPTERCTGVSLAPLHTANTIELHHKEFRMVVGREGYEHVVPPKTISEARDDEGAVRFDHGIMHHTARPHVALAPKEVAVRIQAGHHPAGRIHAEPGQQIATGQFLDELDAADAVLICTPEYAHNLPGSLKNMLDWVVSSGELWRKPVATLSCSPNALGGAKALASLRTTLLAMEANAPEDASLAVPLVRSKLAADGTITDPLLEQALNQVFAALVRVAAQPREL